MAGEAAEADVIQNLRDAGCGPQTVEEFLTLGAQGDLQGQLCLLSKHRKQLLDRIHREEQQISCLDYLVYEMEKDGVG